jgi:hypothetical protein
MQWLRDPKENNAENLNNVKRKVGRLFRKKKEEIPVK